jgi:hypothetical protein
MANNFSNPFTRILGFAVGLLVLTAAVIVGGVVLAAVIGLAVFASLAISLRVWWLRRKLRQAVARGEVAPVRGDRIIETEYHVIEISDEDPDPAPTPGTHENADG